MTFLAFQTALTLPWVQNGSSTFTEQQTNTWPNGLQATSTKTQKGGQISESIALPDGTSHSDTLGPDPIWGIQSPVVTSETLKRGNLTMNISASRTTTLGTPGNPFTVATATETETVNGRTYRSTFTGSKLSRVDTSPAGRNLTVGLDSLERVSSTQASGLFATTFTYDGRGRLASATQGTRKTTFGYNSRGFLASITDPLKLKTSFAYDADGRLLGTTLPDGRVINYTHDANGNITALTPPGESAHDFAYTPVDLPSTYRPPTVVGTGSTTYAYNLDRDLTTITRPDGEEINFGYDSAGRLISIGTPTGTRGFAYNSTTGNLASAAKGNEQITYNYDGYLPTKSTWTGTVAGSVGRTYDNNFWVTSESVGGGNSVAFHYDKDGLLSGAGTLTIRRSANNGLLTGTTTGGATDIRTYNGFGELVGYTASVNSTQVYSVQFIRDADGRVFGKTEAIGGTSNTYSYSYDPAGRLTAATKNGETDTYTYDTNSNRLSATTSSGISNGTYDAQDRLLSYGNASYTYTANGELASQTVGTQRTTYKYDVLGNLVGATLPNGTTITYIIDAENHRVGKEAKGVLETGFLYDGDRIVALLNGNNKLVSQFVYATGSTSPDYMVSGGVTYRIFSDRLGSPVVVVNTSTGSIAEEIKYDEFGNVMSDTNPGFQPFGFAGGLYDQDTKLLRFGVRDYYPATGRWTAKDPILFNGGDTNLYGYVLNDPVNLVDPAGLEGDDDCSACKEKAKEVLKKVVKMELKTYGKPAEEQREIIQEGIKEETSTSPSDEYKQQLDRARERADDSVDPYSETLIQRIWRRCVKALKGDEGSRPPEQPDAGQNGHLQVWVNQ
jgi:RHS repeat-associated protein